MYKVYLINFSYYADKNFETFEQALEWAKSIPFDCAIIDPKSYIAASWGPIQGLIDFRG